MKMDKESLRKFTKDTHKLKVTPNLTQTHKPSSAPLSSTVLLPRQRL